VTKLRFRQSKTPKKKKRRRKKRRAPRRFGTHGELTFVKTDGKTTLTIYLGTLNRKRIKTFSKTGKVSS